MKVVKKYQDGGEVTGSKVNLKRPRRIRRRARKAKDAGITEKSKRLI